MEKYFNKVKLGSDEIGIAAQKIVYRTQDVVSIGTNGSVTLGTQGAVVVNDVALSVKNGSNVSANFSYDGNITIGTGNKIMFRDGDIYVGFSIDNRVATFNSSSVSIYSSDIIIGESGEHVCIGDRINVGADGNVEVSMEGSGGIYLGSKSTDVFIKDKSIEDWCSGSGSGGGGDVVVVAFGTGFGTDVTWSQYNQVKEAIQAGKAVFCTCDAREGYGVAPLVAKYGTDEYNYEFKFRLQNSERYGTDAILTLNGGGWFMNS